MHPRGDRLSVQRLRLGLAVAAVAATACGGARGGPGACRSDDEAAITRATEANAARIAAAAAARGLEVVTPSVADGAVAAEAGVGRLSTGEPVMVVPEGALGLADAAGVVHVGTVRAPRVTGDGFVRCGCAPGGGAMRVTTWYLPLTGRAGTGAAIELGVDELVNVEVRYADRGQNCMIP